MTPSDDSSRQTPSPQLATLWVQHQAALSAYIWTGVANFHDAEDILQQVAADTARRFDHYDLSKSFLAWAIGIARFKMIDYYRSRKKTGGVFDDTALEMLAASYVVGERELDGMKDALTHCMKQVKPKMRSVLEMRYLQELTPVEIAERMGTTANTISVALTRIRKGLASCIKRRTAGEGAR